MVTLIQLEYIIAVDTYRHFVTASEKCFVTQPTLSMQIKKLENDLAVVIFDRTKQPIIPTEIGVKIIEQARTTLAESKKITELIIDYTEDVSGELKIGIIPSLAPYLIPLFIGKFTLKFPNVQIKIVELLTEDIIEQLKKDRLDVGILVTPLEEKGIIEQILFYEEMMIYSNNNHNFAHQKKIKTTEIASPDLWLLSKGHCFRSQVINLCDFDTKSAENGHFEYESGSLETIKKLVETEGGYTILPELALTENPKVSIKKLKGKTPLREVSLVYTRMFSKKRLISLLAEEIIDAIPSKMKDKERGQIVKWR